MKRTKKIDSERQINSHFVSHYVIFWLQQTQLIQWQIRNGNLHYNS